MGMNHDSFSNVCGDLRDQTRDGSRQLPTSMRPLRLQGDTDIGRFCADWARSPALVSLIEAFGGLHPGAIGSTADLLAWLDRFSDIWDYREQKRERNEVITPEFDDETRALVNTAARELGLQDTAGPAWPKYDHVVILGGLARGCVARPLHAAALLRAGTLRARCVTALSAFRPCNRAEATIADLYGVPAPETEFDFMDFGVRHAFGFAGPEEVLGEVGADQTARWRVHRFAGGGDLAPVQVVAAPAPAPDRRANTADTCRWLATRWQTFEAGESMLIVTTFHYRLFQLADAIREIGLPFGLTVDAIGIAPGDIDSRLAWQPTTEAYLQEIRSSIRALHRLLPAAS